MLTVEISSYYLLLKVKANRDLAVTIITDKSKPINMFLTYENISASIDSLDGLVPLR